MLHLLLNQFLHLVHGERCRLRRLSPQIEACSINNGVDVRWWCGIGQPLHLSCAGGVFLILGVGHLGGAIGKTGGSTFSPIEELLQGGEHCLTEHSLWR